MPGTNDFLPIAAGGGANVLTQAAYAALSSYFSAGYANGSIVPAQQLNKAMRQSSLIASIVGALIADVTNQNVVDDGTTATILSNLMATIMRAGYVDDTGVADAYVCTLVPSPGAYYDGMKVGFSTVNINATATPTLNVNGVGPVTITAPGGGALIAGSIPANTIIEVVYNSTGPRFELANIAILPSVGIQGASKNLLALSTGINANVSITADTVIVENTGGAYLNLENVNVTIDTAAAVGVNSLDTGILAGSTWYSTWIIWNGTTIAGLASLSATAPTMPAGYTHKARVGWIRTDGTANKYPLSFKQQGKRANYVVVSGSNVPNLPIMASGINGSQTTPTWVAVAIGAYVPPTAGQIGINLYSQNAVIVAPNNAYGAIASTTNPPYASMSGAASGSTLPFFMGIESANIYWASNAASGVLATSGWEDNL